MKRPEWAPGTGIAPVTVIAAILAIHFLHATYVVTMPVAAAAFIAMVVHPAYAWLRQRLPEKLRWASGLLTLFLVLAVLLLFAGAIALAVTMVAERTPEYVQKAQALYDSVVAWASARGFRLEPGAVSGTEEPLTSRLLRGLQTAGAISSGIVLVLFCVLLMLLEARRWREKVRASLEGWSAQATLDVVGTVSVKVRRYLLAQTLIGAITAVLEGIWLWTVGVDLAFVWAVLFFLLNFIPTLGSIVAAVPPALAALTLGPGRATLAIAGMFVIEQVMGHFVDPKLVGKRLAISPLVVLIAVVFWGWVWGVAGAFLAAPMTVSVIVAFAHVEALWPIALLLSSAGSKEDLIEQTHHGGGPVTSGS